MYEPVSAGYTSTMSDVQFTEESEFSRAQALPEQPALVRLVIRTGLARTERDAEYVLFALIAVCVIAIFFMLTGGKGDAPPQNAYQEGQSALIPPQALIR